jgi:GDP-L-fucose synthase
MSSFWKDKTILLTGGSGFLGSFIYEKMVNEIKINPSNISIPRSSSNDLRKWENCVKVVKDVDIVIHLAARVGGIGYNQQFPGSLFYDNSIMGIQLIEAARQAGVSKFVCIGTVCAYPKYTPTPFKENELWNGYPEETNAPYGLAKKMLLVQLQAYKTQYNFNGIYLLPVNLYGPRDNFDLKSSHVIPALIRKMMDAKIRNEKEVIVWGDGSASREFLYVKDAAEAILLAAEKYNKPDPVNLGSSKEITIKELVNLIAKISGYEGAIIWDTSKPNGQPRRKLDISKAKEEFGFKARTPLEEGLQKTLTWYLQPNKMKN